MARERNKEDSMDEFLDDEEEDDESSDSDGGKAKPWTVDTSSDEDDSKRRKRRKKFDSSDDSSESEAEEKKPAPLPATRSSRRLQKSAPTKDASNDEKSEEEKSVNDVKPRGALRSGINFKDSSLNPEREEAAEEEPEFNDWYDEFLTPEDENNVELSGKLVIMLEIIANAEVVGDKVLVFTQSLASLDLIESALGGGTIGGNQLNWCHGIDYYRMDGSTSVQKRKRWNQAVSFLIFPSHY